MKLRIFALLSLLAATPECLLSQIIYESSSGTSSIVLDDVGIAAVNFGDSSIKLGFTRVVSNQPWRFGLEAEGKSTEGFLEIFKGKDISLPEASASAFAGRTWTPEKGSLLFNLLGLQARYAHGEFNLASEDSANTVEAKSKDFNGLTGTLFYNAFVENFPLPGETLFGVAVTYGERNNFEDLKKVEVCEEMASGTSNGNTSRIQSCKNARSGDYKESTELAADLDVIWYQKWTQNRVAFGLLGRYDGTKDNDRFTPGIGVFFTKDGKPSRFLGGLTAEFADGELKIGLQVGFPTREF